MEHKELLNRLGKNKKVSVALSLGLILAVSGAYLLMIEDPEILGRVVGMESDPLSWEVSFPDLFVNTTTEAGTNSSFAQIKNDNGIVENMSVSFDVVMTDNNLTDSCDIEGDCATILRIDNIIREDGDLIDLPAGLTSLEISTSCKRWSCPQNISAAFSLEVLE